MIWYVVHGGNWWSYEMSEHGIFSSGSKVRVLGPIFPERSQTACWFKGQSSWIPYDSTMIPHFHMIPLMIPRKRKSQKPFWFIIGNWWHGRSAPERKVSGVTRSDSEWPTVDQFSILRSTLKSNLKQFKRVLKWNAYEMPLMPRGAQIVWSLNMLKHVETSVSSVAPHHRFRTTDTPIHRAPVAAEVPMATNRKRIASPNISSSKMFQEMNSLTTFCKCLKLPILDSIRFVMCTVRFLRFSDCTRGLIWGWMGYVLMRVEGLLGDSLWWIRWFSEWWGTEVRMSCIHLQHIFSTGPCLRFQVISGLCFIFDALSAASHLRVTPPPNPSPHGLAEPLKEIFRRGQDPQRSLSRGGF